jgi:hypothetical protein
MKASLGLPKVEETNRRLETLLDIGRGKISYEELQMVER